MQFIRKYKIGMRTIKTGLAIVVSLYIAQFLNLKNPTFVGIAALVSMQSTVNESWIAGKNRMLGTFVGAVIGLALSYLLPNNFIFLGLGIILVIYIHNILKWNKSLVLSCIVFLAIFLNQDGAILSYALNRLLDTFIGIIVSMFINFFIAQPENKQSFIYIKNHIYTVVKKLTYDIVTDKEQLDNNIFKEELNKYIESFEALKNELNMDFSNNSSHMSALNIVKSLDKVEKNLLTLLELNIIPILDEKNITLYQKLYSEESYFKEYKEPQRDHSDGDIIYNYHINKTFNKLLKIEEELQLLKI